MSRKQQRKRLAALDEVAWEAICRRCGACCHERTIGPEGELLAWGPPCPYLDPETHLCVAYDRRFELDVDCHPITPRTLRRPHLLPPGCAYRTLATATARPAARHRGQGTGR